MRPQAEKACNHVKASLDAQTSRLDRESCREVLEELSTEIDARLSALDEDAAQESTEELKKFPHYGNSTH
jgi:hypothetical protein